MPFFSCKRNEQPAKFTATENLTRGKNLGWALKMIVEDDVDTTLQHVGRDMYRIGYYLNDSLNTHVWDTIHLKSVPRISYTVYGQVEAFDSIGKKTEFFWKWRDNSAAELIHFTKAGDSTIFKIVELKKDVLKMDYVSTDTVSGGKIHYYYQ
jgi:hypothetical protein